MAESPSVFKDRQSQSSHTSALPSPALARHGSSGGSHANSPQSQQLPPSRSLLSASNSRPVQLPPVNASTPQGLPLRSPVAQPPKVNNNGNSSNEAAPASSSSAASSSASSASTDVDRGWDAQSDNRFRVALLHNSGNNGSASALQRNRFFDDGSAGTNLDESALQLSMSLRNGQTSPHGAAAALVRSALLEDSHSQTTAGNNNNNTANAAMMDDEPRLEMKLQSSMINFIVTAYTSSGYPTTVTSGLARGSVNGAFVDLRNPSQSVLNLPPRTSLFVSSVTDGTLDENSSSTCYMDTLMKVMWKRSTHLFVSDAASGAAAAMSNTNSASIAAAAQTASANSRTGTAATGNVTGASATAKPASGLSVLQQYPDGIHGVHSSPNLRRILLEGVLPTGGPGDAPALPPNAARPLPPAAAAATNNSNTNVGGSSNDAASEERARNEGNSNANNAPPAPLPPRGTRPVQHTLLASSSYNHLTVYFIAHQAGRVLYSAPLQTLSVSIWGHKVTAQCIFLHGWEEVEPSEDGPAYFSPAPSGPWSAEAACTANGAGGARQRPPIPFRTLRACSSKEEEEEVEEAGGGVCEQLFASHGVQYRGADATRRTVQAALVSFALQPLLLIGNQAGDVLLYDILQEKVVQRLNFVSRQPNAGSEAGGAAAGNTNTHTHSSSGNNSSSNSNSAMVAGSAPVMYNTLNGAGSLRSNASFAGSSARAGGKIVASAVSAIVEVQSGLEKKLTSMLQAAASAKRQGRKEFVLHETTSHTRSLAYYSLSPSLFAVGFDNGQALLICLTMEAAWVLKWFDNTFFGVWPITSIAPRVPNFFMRLWNTMPAVSSAERPVQQQQQQLSADNVHTKHHKDTRARKQTPCTTLVTPIHALLVPDETAHIAAVACNNGTIMLVRLPGLERLTSLSAYDYHAVGGILALCWTVSSPAMLMTPEVLIASGEDDTVTAFQLLHTELYNAHTMESGGMGEAANGGVYGAAEEGGAGSVHCSYSLRVMIKKLFHRSWVSHLAVLPIPAPTCSSSSSSSGNNNPNTSLTSSWPSASPYLGTCLIATSYDSRTSFWPILFHDTLGASSGDFPQNDAELAICTPTRSMASVHSRNAGQPRWMLLDGPTAAPVLHKELTLSATVGGAGGSFFLATLCCRGRVKLWSIVPKSTAGIVE